MDFYGKKELKKWSVIGSNNDHRVPVSAADWRQMLDHRFIMLALIHSTKMPSWLHRTAFSITPLQQSERLQNDPHLQRIQNDKVHEIDEEAGFRDAIDLLMGNVPWYRLDLRFVSWLGRR